MDRTNNTFRFRSYAKINWFLKIGQRRQDGYHNILSIMQVINLYDVIDLYFPKNCDEIICNYEIPTGAESLLGRLFHLIRGLNPGMSEIGFGLNIKKNIPPASGLGGASSNAATVLKIMNSILRLELSQERLIELSATLGSDIPFFTAGYPFAVIGGRGEKITPLPHPPQRDLVLVFPKLGVNTGWAYQEWDHHHESLEPYPILSIDGYLLHLESDHIENMISNDFERIVFRHYPDLKDLKEWLEQLGCSKVFMTGSGSTIIGTAPNRVTAVEIVDRLRQKGMNTIWSTTATRYDNDFLVCSGGGEESCQTPLF